MNSIKNVVDFIDYLTYRSEIRGDALFITLNKENIDSLEFPINELILLLKQLKKSGAVEIITTNSLHNWEKALLRLEGRYFLQLSVNESLLQQYKQSLNQQKEYKLEKIFPDKEIKNLIFVNPEYGEVYHVIINHNYTNPQQVNTKKESWGVLLRLAKNEHVLILEVKDYKNIRTFLNTNKLNRLYSKTGFRPTKIVEIKNGEFIPVIPIQIITQKAYKTRVGKLNPA